MENLLKLLMIIFKSGIKIIDLSADFRLKNSSDYVKWYGWEHPYPDLLNKSVYGVPEIHRNEIKKAQLVSCPGCMAVTSLLALKPLIENDLVDTDHIVVDSELGSIWCRRDVLILEHIMQCVMELLDLINLQNIVIRVK